MSTTKSTISTEGLTTFGARLRHTREEQGLSRPALSKLTSDALSVRVIDHLENGTTDATGPRVEMLSKALGVNRNWLMFGEPVSAMDGIRDNPKKALIKPESAPDSPQRALEVLDAAQEVSKKRESPFTLGHQEKTTSIGAVNQGAERHYFDAMRQALSNIEQLREDGLEKHPRKLPKLLEKAVEIGQCLEQSDFRELATIRNADIAELSDDTLPEELLGEITLRLIDTALLGLDLYDLDMDTLEAFAERIDIGSPFLGWKSHMKIVQCIRGAYWKEALKGGLRLTTSLRHSG
ncbi:MAG: hypothetical protein COB37_05955 [Kordiimonadales bacterium]|nr:MAG: hypothetical protein COB37_05955 [Kordiimonadales bacterium]